MVYKQVRSAEEFTAPLFIREDGYWKNLIWKRRGGRLLLLTVPG